MSEISTYRNIIEALVVDDDPFSNVVLRTLLGPRGLHTVEVATGEAAIACLEQNQVDLIFLDVSLPGIDGLEVLDWIRQRRLDVAVVMTTAFGSEKVVIEAMRRGADDFIKKPVEAEEFYIVLNRAIARLELLRQNRMLRAQVDEQHLRLRAELARAGEIQRSLLPGPLLTGPHLDLAARCLPARVVGGDFYDWQILKTGAVFFSVGDVMGKGMPAALLMTSIRSALRAAAYQLSMLDAVNSVANALGPDLENSESYLTLFSAELDLVTSRLTYVDAGHGHAIICHASGATETLAPSGFPVGLFHPVTYSAESLMLQAGDTLVVYSDGLADSFPSFRDPPSVINDVVRSTSTAEEAAARLLEYTNRGDPATDDVTVVVLRCR
jgi:sigma-B regulation protein RsbU (phosphoserine phosphatase)